MNLETERLILRNLRASDLDDFHIYHCDPEICKYQSYDVFSVEDSRQFIEEQSRKEFGVPGEWAQAGIELKENGKLVGDFALKALKDEPRTVELGVTLNPQYQGKGIAVELFKRIFEYLFDETETHRIIGILDIENDGSRKLMENLNMRREAHFKKSYWDRGFNEWRDEYLYALLKEDWQNNFNNF